MRRGLHSGSIRVLGRVAGQIRIRFTRAVALSVRKRDGTIDGRILPLS